MKIFYLFIGAITFVISANAHQIANQIANQNSNNKDNKHDSFWNWNKPNHSHDNIAHDNIAEKEVVKQKAYKKFHKERTYASVIKGIKGLDAIAEVGECYTTAYVEARCSDGTKEVLISPKRTETEIVPAVTKEVEESVMIASTKTVKEFVPALYKNIGKRVMIAPERTEWKKGNFSSIQKTIGGEIYCLITVPAKYKNKVEKVLQIPATTKTRTIPAVYKTYKRTVIVAPATTKIVRTIPAAYETVSACIDNKAGHYEWRSVLCEQNATNSVLTNIERALANSGHLINSEVDGVIDDTTTNALKSYQRQQNLAVDGLVNMETVKALGVTY